MDNSILETINKYRNVADWESVETEVRRVLEKDRNDADALRILSQSIEKLGRDDELIDIWIRLVEVEESPGATAKRLAQTLQENEDNKRAVKYYHRAMLSFLKTKNYDQVENVWLELVGLAPEPPAPYMHILEGLIEKGQGKRATVLAQMLWPHYVDKGAWAEVLQMSAIAAAHGPTDDETTRNTLVSALEHSHSECEELDSILNMTGLRRDRPLNEGYDETKRLIPFSKGKAFRHPDWGVGIVQHLDVVDRKIKIDFQRRKGHAMAVDLAERALDMLDDDDYRTIRIKNPERAKSLVDDDPLFLARSVIKSFGGSASARQIKERLCGDIIETRKWNRWWSDVQTMLSDDRYVGVTGGAAKTYTLRDEPATIEEEWLTRIDRIRNVLGKLDVIKKYLQHLKKADRDRDLLEEMAARTVGLAQKQKKPEAVVEVVLTLADLEDACEGFAADPKDLNVETYASEPHIASKLIPLLRSADHQARFAAKIQETQEEAWPEIFHRLLLSSGIEIRDQLTDALHDAGHHDKLADILRVVSLDPRQYVPTYTWLADRTLRSKAKYMVLDISIGVLFERLLQIVDFLSDQAKRQEKDEADRLRKMAARIREIIKGRHYEVFHDLLPNLDRGQAVSIYRRASTNTGLDVRAREHITSRILSRYPDLFAAEEEIDTGPPRLFCLPETLREKQQLLERLSSVEIPTVTREMETARQMGDLRENAEYHAARDKIRLLSAQASELQEQLGMAQSIPLNQVDYSNVGFGTKVQLRAPGGESTEVFYFLGPWESDPDRNILSYNAPFARPFLGQGVGDLVEVELSTHTGRYVIELIEAFDPQQILQKASPEPDANSANAQNPASEVESAQGS